MNVLAIGNSFSEDATRYLHGIARADGETLNVVNLYIGGCSLEKHFRNMLSEAKAYELQYNGEKTGFYVSIKDALLNRRWDVVTLQQASPVSFEKDSYFPYINSLAEYVRAYSPKAKLYIHQTWAYEDGSERLAKLGRFERAAEMRNALISAYDEAAKAINADGIIPSGRLLGALLDNGVEKVHRDTYHASRGLGRYAIALLWYSVLTGRSVADNTFSDFDEEVSEAEVAIAKKCVEEKIEKYER